MGSIWFIVESTVHIIHKKNKNCLYFERDVIVIGLFYINKKSHLYDGKGLDINRKCDLRDLIFFLFLYRFRRMKEIIFNSSD